MADELAEVFLLEHVHVQDDGEEDVKTIGIYSSRQAAEEAIVRARTAVGFRDAPDGFNIDCYRLNQDHRTGGYVTVKTPR